MTELSNIVTLLENTYGKTPWHGPSVKDAISGVTHAQSLLRLDNSHSINELVGHMISWRLYTIHKLRGTAFKITDALNFPAETDWKKLVKQLDENQKDLLDAIKKFDAKKLADIVPSASHEYSYYTLLHGIIHHDLYHTGQIMIIRKHFGL